MKVEDVKEGVVVRNRINGLVGVPYTGSLVNIKSGESEVPIVYRLEGNLGTAPLPVLTPVSYLEKYELKPEDKITTVHVKEFCMSEKGSCRYYANREFGHICAKVLGTDMPHEIDNWIISGGAIKEGEGINCDGKFNQELLDYASKRSAHSEIDA